MPVVLARVDNRLVHGQVLEAWVPRLGIEAILVVDADLAQDPFQRAVIEGLGF
ncbi:MAG: PTS sugar transporter subunit IIB, partial [Deltaproteobacteria bacterium]|nr:PTS sugar transporter subunit IIB [Deltaproteobacteria bacterium]